MNFNFAETAGLGTATTRQLEGNKIHTVKFDGCEAADFKDGQYKVLKLKFSNEDGAFTHTIFEPREGDELDTQGSFGPNPSVVKGIITTLRHLGAAVSPELIKQLDSMPANMSWDQLRNKVVEATKDGIGKETKIKLFKKISKDINTGEQKEEAVFPRYIIAYNREGKLYMKTNFIGSGVYFTTKELDQIKKQETATPTTIAEAPAKKQDDADFDDEI